MQTDPTADTRIQLRLPRKLSSPAGNAGSKASVPPTLTEWAWGREGRRAGWRENHSPHNTVCSSVLHLLTRLTRNYSREQTQAQTGKVTHPKSHSQKVTEPALKTRQKESNLTIIYYHFKSSILSREAACKRGYDPSVGHPTYQSSIIHEDGVSLP